MCECVKGDKVWSGTFTDVLSLHKEEKRETLVAVVTTSPVLKELGLGRQNTPGYS